MKLTTNRLPVLTWNSLKMNDVTLDVPDTDKSDVIKRHITSDDDPLEVMPFVFDEGLSYGGEVKIAVDPDIKSSIIMDFSSGDTGYSNVKTTIELRNKSHFTLYQVFKQGDEHLTVNDVYCRCEDMSSFELVQIFLSGKEIYAQVKTDLDGTGSSLKIESAYKVVSDHILDINYVAIHSGEKSVSDIKAFGALCDTAKKRFRGTIDFKPGCAGAIGNEAERVLLLDENVENKTIPIILCAEENVEGNHGATIGKPDDETLYYMHSRGIDDVSINEMMKNAYVDALVSRLPECEYKDSLLGKA